GKSSRTAARLSRVTLPTRNPLRVSKRTKRRKERGYCINRRTFSLFLSLSTTRRKDKGPVGGSDAMETRRTRPSIGRWYILLLLGVMYLITYLDRVNISTAAPVISKEFGFDKVTMGAIFSAFVWAYAMFQVPGGWLGDRFGPRRVLTIIVAYWSVMTAATAAATGAVSFVIIRFLFGVGEAGAFPGRLWCPVHQEPYVFPLCSESV